MKVSFGGAL
jgi:hypothetical protein